ncbi:hypothetical protein Tco_0817181, partial [Tanacetum coccineum]
LDNQRYENAKENAGSAYQRAKNVKEGAVLSRGSKGRWTGLKRKRKRVEATGESSRRFRGCERANVCHMKNRQSIYFQAFDASSHLPLFDPPRHDGIEATRSALNFGMSIKTLIGVAKPGAKKLT